MRDARHETCELETFSGRGKGCDVIIRLLAVSRTNVVGVLLDAGDDMEEDERTPLLNVPRDRGLSKIQREEDASSIVRSHVTEEEQKLADASVGERLA